jgi:hypothetical protein
MRAYETYTFCAFLMARVALPGLLGQMLNGCALPSDLKTQTVGDLGRFEYRSPKPLMQGAMIGAPHGSFDEHTAELVNRIAYRTGLAAVIAKGFTPTESGGGWRINVNRPSERRYPAGEIEIATQRARVIYENFKNLVIEAAQGHLDLYIDIHQNGRAPNIEVATVGVSEPQARLIKKTFREIRDLHLRDQPLAARIDLAIEPLDKIEIGAWAAKAEGILSAAKRSLHFELPAAPMLGQSDTRAIYTLILTEMVRRLPGLLRAPSSHPALFQTGLDLSGLKSREINQPEFSSKLWTGAFISGLCGCINIWPCA